MNKSILIIEDHPIYRDALSILISGFLGDACVLTASSAEEGLTQLNSTGNVGLILLDLELPGIKGAHAVTSLRRKSPSTEIIVVSGSEDRRDVEAVLRAGAKAFISKSVSTTVIMQIAQKVLRAEPLESTWITVSGNQEIAEEQMLKLTGRQKETLVYLCMGLPNKEIGFRLGLSEITVKTHVSSIFRALGVINRTQAVLAARRVGLFIPEQTK